MLTFGAPAFLWGVTAVAIPIAIHLINFRRYRRIYFSNVDVLAELQSSSRRSRELRQWFILAMRCLAIVALVLAFARPAIGGRNGEAAGRAAVSIYIDNSYSMEAAANEGSLLSLARLKAREIASAHSPSDRFQLLTSDLAPHEMRWLNRDELIDAIDRVEPSPASPLVSEVVGRQGDFLSQSGAASRHTYILSDFQRSGADIDRLEGDSSLQLTLIPLAQASADNIYIDTVVLDAPAYFAGGAVDVRATLRNGGSRKAEGIPIRLRINGRERAIATTDIAAGEQTTVDLHFAIEEGGWIDGTVEIDDHPVTFDDRYYFAIAATSTIRAIELHQGHPNAHVARLFAADTAIRLQSTTTLPQLDEVDFIILSTREAVPSGEAQQIAQWVDEGGSLLVVPPAAADVSTLNSMLQSLGAPSYGQWVVRPTRANAIDYNSSLYRGVFSSHSDEMEMPSVQGHYLIQGGTAQHTIGLADGSDLLCITTHGQGRIYLLSTPLEAEWTDLVAQALFVPTIFNMALYSRRITPASFTLGGRNPIPLHGLYDPNATPPQLSDGQDIALMPDLRRTGGRQVMVPHGELTHDGIYTLADEHIAFNYPRRESNLEFLTAEEIAEAAHSLPGVSMLQAGSGDLGTRLRERENGHQLWRWCVIMALIALAAETAAIHLRRK